ncbi:MAG: hypothetical protein EXR29_09035 [Betaproteobacteria bacterium]|nr:hypothetical protein [Betaproteobacteria bacterium]
MAHASANIFAVYLYVSVHKVPAHTNFHFSFAGWVRGFGAQKMGYAAYFALTFSLAFPAYLFLPWVRQMLAGAAAATNS